MTFAQNLRDGGTYLLDGAFGTELLRRGFNSDKPLPGVQALIHRPDLVKDIHVSYIEAGADIITANTFCTSDVALDAKGIPESGAMLVERAFDLAREAVDGSEKNDIVVVGSMAPASGWLGKSFTERQLLRAQENHAAQLALAGFEVVLCETMTSVQEARVALKAAKTAGIEAIVSLVAKDSRHLHSGETIDTAIRTLSNMNPLGIGLNCCSMGIIDATISTVLSLSTVPVGAWAAIDAGEKPALSAVQYVRYAMRWLDAGVQIIGGCCGTTPEHIKTIRSKMQQKDD